MTPDNFIREIQRAKEVLNDAIEAIQDQDDEVVLAVFESFEETQRIMNELQRKMLLSVLRPNGELRDFT